jgi:hypothetical protein
LTTSAAGPTPTPVPTTPLRPTEDFVADGQSSLQDNALAAEQDLAEAAEGARRLAEQAEQQRRPGLEQLGDEAEERLRKEQREDEETRMRVVEETERQRRQELEESTRIDDDLEKQLIELQRRRRKLVEEEKRSTEEALKQKKPEDEELRSKKLNEDADKDEEGEEDGEDKGEFFVSRRRPLPSSHETEQRPRKMSRVATRERAPTRRTRGGVTEKTAALHLTSGSSPSPSTVPHATATTKDFRTPCANGACQLQANRECANQRCKTHCCDYQANHPDEAKRCTVTRHRVLPASSARRASTRSTDKGRHAACTSAGCKKKSDPACPNRCCTKHCLNLQLLSRMNGDKDSVQCGVAKHITMVVVETSASASASPSPAPRGERGIGVV